MFVEDLFYKRLTELRMEKGVSARDMSLSLGQSENYINSIENRHSFPSMQVFFYICDYFGITPMEFFDMENKRPSDTARIAEKLKGLSRERLAIIEAMIDNMK